MRRELLILRHGKSDWSVDVDDFHRPLKNRGKRGARRMGAWLLQQQLLPDHIVSSPAERALATAGKVCKATGMKPGDIHQDRRVYAAGLDQLLEVLASCPEKAHRVLLVGHNPGLEELLEYLTDGEAPVPDDGKMLPTAALARLYMPGDWHGLAAGCARLESVIRPGALPG
ncbi:MAG: histidine phosphatase family protein [Gammaproteobacteria bacterium]|jgi:phosphohistidine phosphatase